LREPAAHSVVAQLKSLTSGPRALAQVGELLRAAENLGG
jgi:hypothetical protein